MTLAKHFHKLNSNLIFPVFWLVILLITPVLNNSLNHSELAIFLLTIILSTTTGAAILIHSNTVKDHFIFWPASLLLGSLFISILIIFAPSSVSHLILIATGIAAVLALLFSQNRLHSFEGSVIHPLALLPALVLPLLYFFLSADALQSANIVPFQIRDALPDTYFFTLVAHSYSQFPFSNSFFDFGATLSYQPVAFFPPALLTKISGIPAQVTLWGIWMPFYIISAPLIIAYTAVKHFCKSKKQINGCFILAVVLFYSLAPINPKYLLSFDIEKIVWLGTGYLLPGGNPPFTAAILIGGIIMYIFFSKQNFSNTDKILFVLLTALLINTKIAFYIPFGIFLGVISLIEVFKNGKKQKIVLLLLSLIPALLIYLYPFNSSASVRFFFESGYYLNSFMKLADVSSMTSGFIIMALSLFLWGGIRFLIIAVGIIKKSTIAHKLSYGAFTALLLSILFPLLLRLKMIAPDGTLLQDATFDLVQFVRSAYFILTIAGLFIIFSLWKEFFSKKAVLIPLILFCGMVNLSNVARLSGQPYQEEDQKWRNEVREELKTLDPDGLLAIKGDRKYSGQLLAAEGFGPWWFTTKRGDGSGYIMSNKNYYRAVAVDSLINGSHPLQALGLMTAGNVDYFIATPDTKPRLDSLRESGLLKQESNFEWVYKIQ